MCRMEPTISIGRTQVAASKQFTDRTDFIDVFNTSLKTIKSDSTKVISYYGVGGIGKTSLKKELQSQINKGEKSLIWVEIDFDISQHRMVDNALIFMRSNLNKKYKVKFPLFDFAYTYYLQKIMPHISLNNDTIPFLEESELLCDVVSTFKDVPLVSVTTGILGLIDKGYKAYTNWGAKNKVDEFTDMALMDPNELLARLPSYFAEDIKDFCSNKDEQLIVFMDTYEALWNGNKGNFFETDGWIRDVLIPNLPGVLFIILGREKLRWETCNSGWSKCLEQHIIGTLAPSDARLFLKSCNIFDEEIVNRIIDISEGLPYSLDLCVDTYYTIKRNRNQRPLVEDFNFENNQIKIFERFMRYLEESERELLKALSATRYWDEEIASELIREYNIGYSILKIEELAYFSFISERTIEETWEMNSLMRTSLQNYQDEKQFKRIHLFMFNYYLYKLEKMNLSNPNQVYLNEAYYHGKNSLNIDEFSNWFVKSSKIYIKAGKIQFLTELFQELYDESKTNNFAEISYILGEIYMLLGKYEKAEKILDSNIITDDLLLMAKIKGLLATLQRGTYKYKQSDSNFKDALEELEKLEQTDKSILTSIAKIKYTIDYGKLKVYLSENKKAIELYRLAIEDADQALKMDQQKCTILNLKAIAFEKLGEVSSVIRDYEVTESSYKQAIEIYEKINEIYFEDLEEDINLIYLINNKGILYKRLAGFYIKQEEFEMAKTSYEKALEIYNESINIFPENVDTLNKMGFASRGLLRLLVTNNMYKDEINAVLEQTIGFFDRAIELSPRGVAAIYSKGGAYRIMAKSYEENQDYDEAIRLQDMSIELADKAINIQPDYIYAYNGKADALTSKGDISVLNNDKVKAVELYKEAIASIEELLKRTPKDDLAIERKEKIKNKISDIGL